MPRDFFDPTPEEQRVVLIDTETRRKAEKLIESCEYCNSLGAEIPFDNVLDHVTGSDPSVTDYILEQPNQRQQRRVCAVHVFRGGSIGNENIVGDLGTHCLDRIVSAANDGARELNTISDKRVRLRDA